MRIQKQDRDYFKGTHKGAQIEITRNKDGNRRSSRFYIEVRDLNGEGSCVYDAWAPAEVQTMAEAKREAIHGARLDDMVEVKDCPGCAGKGCFQCKDIGLVPA